VHKILAPSGCDGTWHRIGKRVSPPGGSWSVDLENSAEKWGFEHFAGHVSHHSS